MCQFYEVYNGSYLRYRSVVDGSRYIGFNKFGKPMKNPHGRQECFNFIKYNPHADINHHNSLVNAEMGGMEPREPYVVSRKPSPVMRATKNSLLQADSAREHAHTSTHRQRHPNRWKNRQDGADSGPWRRHESRPLVEASKYWAACELADQDCLLHYPVRTWDQTAKYIYAGGPLVVGMSGAHLTAPRESRLEAPRIRSNSVGESRAWTRPLARTVCENARIHTHTYARLIAAPVQFPFPPGWRFRGGNGRRRRASTWRKIEGDAGRPGSASARVPARRSYLDFTRLSSIYTCPDWPLQASMYLVTIRAFFFSNHWFLVSLVRAMNRSLSLCSRLFFYTFNHSLSLSLFFLALSIYLPSYLFFFLSFLNLVTKRGQLVRISFTLDAARRDKLCDTVM